MSKITRGVFISDLHLPWNIKLKGVLDYIKDTKPDIVILGGDIIDASGTFGVDAWTMEKVEKDGFDLYKRDVKLMKDLIADINDRVPKAEFIFLEGNHEERYQRMFRKYPTALEGKFKFQRDAVPESVKSHFKWIPYGDYQSFWKLGDLLFTHGTLFPDSHAKKMSHAYIPNKVVYGHIHDLQAYTTHSGDPHKPGRYALTAGCLCSRLPDYKKGTPNKWVNGFVTFACVNGVTTPTPILIEDWGFMVGTKLYK
jgi:predicted phosphodiesterase